MAYIAGCPIHAFITRTCGALLLNSAGSLRAVDNIAADRQAGGDGAGFERNVRSPTQRLDARDGGSPQLGTLGPHGGGNSQ